MQMVFSPDVNVSIAIPALPFPKCEITLWLQKAFSVTQMLSKGCEAESALGKLSGSGVILWAIPWTDRYPFVTGGS